jgi:A/G-specific adenine glycosylase
MDSSLHPFSAIILSWYSNHKRDLPWRNNKIPYSIWLSEIILQQTRVDQGLSYYLKFLEAFPKVKQLAEAQEDHVMQLWQGLGYYSRARNLHAAAKMIMNDFNGKFPSSYDDLRKLPGVGPYTASAIASIAFNLPHAVVDGNVYRLLSRYFNIDTPIDSGAGVREFFDLANELMSVSSPGDFNQAMMDFGSMVCKPTSPLCNECPLNAGCLALKNETTASRPIKRGKTKVSKRYFIYLIIKDDEDYTLVRKRGDKDIWAGLYEFPLIEFQNAEEWQHFESNSSYKEMLERYQAEQIILSKPVKHILSHQQLHVLFANVSGNTKSSDHDFERRTKSELTQLGMPRVITRYLEQS